MTPGVPWIGPGFNPDIVMMRAPTSAIDPDGLSVFTVNPIGVPFASGASAFACAPSTNVNVCPRSRVNRSGPSDQ
jgi:hypothetical protein